MRVVALEGAEERGGDGVGGVAGEGGGWVEVFYCGLGVGVSGRVRGGGERGRTPRYLLARLERADLGDAVCSAILDAVVLSSSNLAFVVDFVGADEGSSVNHECGWRR